VGDGRRKQKITYLDWGKRKKREVRIHGEGNEEHQPAWTKFKKRGRGTKDRKQIRTPLEVYNIMGQRRETHKIEKGSFLQAAAKYSKSKKYLRESSRGTVLGVLWERNRTKTSLKSKKKRVARGRGCLKRDSHLRALGLGKGSQKVPGLGTGVSRSVMK